MMDGHQDWAVEALQALGHSTRLSVFRLLVQAGSDGRLAGEIAQACGVPASTMSHHLANLERADLVRSKRQSREIRYSADYASMRRLLAYLMEDCCQGNPLLCADLPDITACLD